MNEQPIGLSSVAGFFQSFGRESVDRQRLIEIAPRTTWQFVTSNVFPGSCGLSGP